jgi:hypothetical protein
MRLKAKIESSFYDKKNMYSWVFVNGVMFIANEETYNFTLKESYFHRLPYYKNEINLNEISKNERKRESNIEK